MPFDVKRMSVTRLEKREMALTGWEVAELLRRAGVAVPEGAEVTFTVPRGGDFSGTVIDIDMANPITLKWSIKTTEPVDG